MEFAFGWLILSLLVSFLASSRGRNGFGFFLLSILLSPLLGFIVVLVIKNIKEEEERTAQQAIERAEEHELQLASINAIASSVAVRPPAGEAPSVLGTLADELEKLASLRDRGILTPEEFAQQKQIALNRTSR